MLSFVTHPIEVTEKIDRVRTDGKHTLVEPGVYQQWTHAQCPMGCQASPGAFCSALSDTLRKWVPQYYGNKIIDYADDLLVCGEDYQDCWNVLKACCEALWRDGWTLSRDKSALFQKSVKFLGMVISSAGIEPDGTTGVTKLYGDKDKVMSILNLQRPKDIKELRGFLGMANFFRIFVPAFAQISAP
eukprot:SAG31_NODE_11600_length_1014_cov_1.483060_1_plen_186_part_10